MDRLTDQIDDALGAVRVEWSTDRAQRIQRGMARRARTRARVRAAAAGGALLALLAFAGTVLVGPRRAVEPVARAGQPAEVLRARDGSIVTPLDDHTTLRWREQTDARMVLSVEAGAARFAITHRPARLFRVEAGGVAVQVLGTVFAVERRGARTRVAVESGRVRVFAGARTVDLGAGEADWFGDSPAEASSASPGAVAASASTAEDAAPAPAPAPAVVPHATRVVPRAQQAAAPPTPVADAPARDWRARARERAYDDAYTALMAAGSGAVGDSFGDVLLAVDVARRSHHPATAEAFLARALATHAAGGQAATAAFTLGRVRLEDLGQPRAAAEAFAQAWRLDPEGSLAEDALAREVGAWSQAGDSARAGASARRYLERYPNGRRAAEVRRLGAVE